jgi:hypothetical protein
MPSVGAHPNARGTCPPGTGDPADELPRGPVIEMCLGTQEENPMRLTNVYPFLAAYYRALGLTDEEIEEMAARAWDDGVGPTAVYRRQDGTWAIWGTVRTTLDADLRAKILASLPYPVAEANFARSRG